MCVTTLLVKSSIQSSTSSRVCPYGGIWEAVESLLCTPRNTDPKPFQLVRVGPVINGGDVLEVEDPLIEVATPIKCLGKYQWSGDTHTCHDPSPSSSDGSHLRPVVISGFGHYPADYVTCSKFDRERALSLRYAPAVSLF